MLRIFGALAFVIHIAAGALSLVAGTVAAVTPKGRRWHRKAGTVFIWSMFLMAAFAAYLAVVEPDQNVNLFISTLVVYLVATAWTAVRPLRPTTLLANKITLGVALALWAPFAILSFQLATGITPLFKSAVPFDGAVLIAVYSFTCILTLAVIGDIRILLDSKITGATRLKRRLWRVLFALTLATGSAFTNGFARLLPGSYYVPLYLHLPKLLPLGLLAFWFVRVQLLGVRAIAPVHPNRQPDLSGSH